MTVALAVRTPRPAVGLAMVLSSGLLYGINGTVSKLILRAGLDAPQLTELRAVGASLGLLALCLVVRPGPRRLAVPARELPLLAGYGLAGFFLVPMLYYVAISRLPVGIALLFEYTAPLLVALWARFGQRQPVKPRLWGGLVVSIVGLAAVAQVWRSGTGTLDPIGVAAGLGAAVLFALYYLLGARGVARRDALSLNFWAFAVAAVAGAVVRPLWTFPVGVLSGTSNAVPVWLLVAYLIGCGSVAPYLLVAAALRHLPPTSVGILGMVEPVVASTVAYLALGEALTPAQLLGGVLILIGVTLAETARTPGPGEPGEIPVG